MMYVRSFECAYASVGVCPLTSSPLRRDAVACSPLPLVLVQQNRMCSGKEGGDGRKGKRGVGGGGLLGGGCLSP